MSAPKLTEAQRDFLKRIDAGFITKCADFTHPSWAKTIDDLQWAELIDVSDWRLGPAQYVLTDAGRAALRGES